ncbi:MAG: hypothetical protein ACI9JL_000001, partial [Paracoccaceae bacterium]
MFGVIGESPYSTTLYGREVIMPPPDIKSVRLETPSRERAITTRAVWDGPGRGARPSKSQTPLVSSNLTTPTTCTDMTYR